MGYLTGIKIQYPKHENSLKKGVALPEMVIFNILH